MANNNDNITNKMQKKSEERVCIVSLLTSQLPISIVACTPFVEEEKNIFH